MDDGPHRHALTLTVVVCTLDRPAAVRGLVAALRPQLGPGRQLVVVDQSAVPVALDGERVVHHLPPSLPVARNVGAGHASGEVVLFLDDDTTPSPGLLDAHLAQYADPRVGGVVGRIVEVGLRANARTLVNGIGWDGRIRTCLDWPADGEVATLKGANMSFRRSALVPFDPGFAGTSLLEDADASARVARAGWRLRYAADAVVVHDHAPGGGVRATARGPRADAAWRLHNTGRFVRRHRGWAGVAVALGPQLAVALRLTRSPSAAAALLGSFVRGAVGA